MASLTPILLDAKKEYVHQLSDIMLPYVMRTISGLYDHAKHKPKQFRMMLQQVPSWNDQVIKDKTAEIERKYSQLQNLITACCVSYTKVLGSIRLNTNQNSNIRLSVPDTSKFVHSVYIYVAKEFFYEPKMLYSNRASKNDLMREAVEESVRQNVPIDQLLEAYLTVSVDNEGIDPIAASADMDHTTDLLPTSTAPRYSVSQQPQRVSQQQQTPPEQWAQQMPPPQQMPQQPQQPQQQQMMMEDDDMEDIPLDDGDEYKFLSDVPPPQPPQQVPQHQQPSQPLQPQLPQQPPSVEQYMPIQIQQDDMFGSDDEGDDHQRHESVDFL